MPKRLKWLRTQLRDLFPANWQIRYRLVSAGIALSILSLLSPFYMRAQLASLASRYERTKLEWEALDSLHRLDSLVSESQGAAAATVLAELRLRIEGDTDAHFQTLTELQVAFNQWRRSSGDTRLLLNLQRLSGRLERELKAATATSQDIVMQSSRKSVLVVTYGGFFFFVGFGALMLSLWYTLMPGLSALLTAAKELKRGNLDYRVNIHGRSETAQLARAFNEMAVSLKEQNEKLKELNRLKTDFVSTVSHELRTPLTAIKGSIGLILGGVTGEIPEETRGMLGITQKNTDRLIRLINEVLDIAKIEAGAIQMRFDKYSLVDTINHAVLGIEAFAQTQGIKLEWTKPQPSPLVVIDRDRIEQVITNLLSNAIKFTEPGGTVRVTCEWEADRVIIAVSDTGQGIPEEFLERIFQKFQQAESAAHKAKEGTGLGLTIAKAIVEEHGGSIWVASKVATGSTFSFSLPWNGAEFAAPPKAKTVKAA